MKWLEYYTSEKFPGSLIPREQAHHHLDVAFPAGPGLPRCQMQLGRSLAANVVDISIYHQCIANVAFILLSVSIVSEKFLSTS